MNDPKDIREAVELLAAGVSIIILFRDGVWVVWTAQGAFQGASLDAAIVRALEAAKPEPYSAGA